MAWLQLLVAIGKWKGIWIPCLTHYSREPANTYSYDRCTNQGWRSYLNILKSNLGTKGKYNSSLDCDFASFPLAIRLFHASFVLWHAMPLIMPYSLSGRKAFSSSIISCLFPEPSLSPLVQGQCQPSVLPTHSGLTSILTLITVAYNELFTCLSPPG